MFLLADSITRDVLRQKIREDEDKYAKLEQIWDPMWLRGKTSEEPVAGEPQSHAGRWIKIEERELRPDEICLRVAAEDNGIRPSYLKDTLIDKGCKIYQLKIRVNTRTGLMRRTMDICSRNDAMIAVLAFNAKRK